MLNFENFRHYNATLNYENLSIFGVTESTLNFENFRHYKATLNYENLSIFGVTEATLKYEKRQTLKESQKKC
jgi:hypothetical protein